MDYLTLKKSKRRSNNLEQLPFALPSSASYLEEDYFLTNANFSAKEWIDKWPNWGSSKLSNITLVIGSPGSGKTHLARIWQAKSTAIQLSESDILNKKYMELRNKSFLLEDLNKMIASEEPIFHLLNYVLNNEKFLLITCTQTIAKLDLQLPDLISRLKSIVSVQLETPSLEMIEQVLFKNFSDRQISVDDNLVAYLSKRIPRSYPAIQRTVAELDKISLANKRRLTIPFVRKYLRYY